VGWTKGPYEYRNNFNILIGKPFEKQSFGRTRGDGRLLRNTDFKIGCLVEMLSGPYYEGGQTTGLYDQNCSKLVGYINRMQFILLKPLFH